MWLKWSGWPWSRACTLAIGFAAPASRSCRLRLRAGDGASLATRLQGLQFKNSVPQSRGFFELQRLGGGKHFPFQIVDVFLGDLLNFVPLDGLALDLTGGDLPFNLTLVDAILAGRGPAGLVDTIVLNASIAYWITGHVADPREAVPEMRNLLVGGAVAARIKATREFFA